MALPTALLAATTAPSTPRTLTSTPLTTTATTITPTAVRIIFYANKQMTPKIKGLRLSIGGATLH